MKQAKQLATQKPWRNALRYSLPIAMGYIPAAIAFGVLMSAAQLPFWWAFSLSIFLYSGAAQFALIPLLAQATNPFSMWLNVSVINLRHIFYALPLLKTLPKNKIKKAYCLFGLTDESFSTLTSLSKQTQKEIFFLFILFNQISWVSGTVLGFALGGELNELIPNLDFALTALFIILAFEQFKTHQQRWPIYITIFFFLLTYSLFPTYSLLASIGLCSLFILLKTKNEIKEKATL